MSDDPEEREALLWSPRAMVWSTVACLAIGAVVGVMFFYPDEWSVGRRLLGGLLTGGFTAFVLLANRGLAS